jgi:hypothetical protein
MARTKPVGKAPAKKRRVVVYTVGERNKLIDSALHPLAKIHPVFTIIDELLHAANEQNPTESFEKFVKYSLPVLLKGIERMLKKDQ